MMARQDMAPHGHLSVTAWARGQVRGQGRGTPIILWKEFSKRILLWTIGGTLFLSMLLSLVELFSILWKFLARDASLSHILQWIGLGTPKHLVDSLPVAFLFAIVITLSNWHATNELEAVFSAGISLQRFLLPLFVFALAFCAAEFYITDAISIPFLRIRNTLQSEILKESDSRATVPGFIAEGGRFVYTYRYFDEKHLRLYDIVIVERDRAGNVLRKLSAPNARWEGGRWMFPTATIYEESNGAWRYARIAEFSDPAFAEPPSGFSRPTTDVRLLSTKGLQEQIHFLKAAGLPWVDAAVEKERRLSFSLTPLIVIGLAGVFAGRFRKSIFLLSMLFSLASATLYYVAQMIASLAAKAGVLSPVLSMWGVVLGFSVVSIVAYLRART
jgi:lipopolysaccharide export system permease protein